MPPLLQYCYLENPTDRRAWWATVYGVIHSWTRLKWLSSSSSSSSRHEKGSTESDQDRMLINTEGKTSLNQWKLSWNLEDEKKFASQGGGDSSRKTSLCQDTKDNGVFKYCIQDLKEGAISRAKKSAQKMKGCLWDSHEGGSSGEFQRSLDAYFVTLSLSISMKRKVIACSGSCKALMDSRISLILGPRRLTITSRSSSVPHHGVPRWRVMPQGHSQSPHTRRISRANLSLSLSNSTMFHVLQSILCPLLSSLSMASNTLCQVKPTSSRWGENPEGWFSNRSLQEPLGCGWKESALCRPSRTISDAAKPCFWARACHKINLLRVKGCLGHWSSWNKYEDDTPCHLDRSHKANLTDAGGVFQRGRCFNIHSFSQMEPKFHSQLGLTVWGPQKSEPSLNSSLRI